MTLKTVETGSTTSDKSYFEEEIIVEEEIVEDFGQVSSYFEVASDADGDEHDISHQTRHLHEEEKIEDFSQVSSYIEVTVADEDEHDIAHQTRHPHEVLPVGKHGKDPPRLARDDSGDSKDSGFDLELGPNSDRELSGVTECVLSTRSGSSLLQSRAFGHSSDLRKCGSAIVAGADTQQDWFRTTHHIDTPIILEEPLEDFSQVSSYIEVAPEDDEDEHGISHQTRHPHEVLPICKHGKDPPRLARDDSGDSKDSGFDLELGPNSDREVSGLTECVLSTRITSIRQSPDFGHSNDLSNGSSSGGADDYHAEDAAQTVHSGLDEAENDDTLHTNAFHESSVNDDTLHTNAMSTLAVESTNDDTLHTNTPTLAYESIDDSHGYNCDVMVPKKRASQVQQEQRQQDEKNTSTEVAFQGFNNADPNLEELEDMTIDDGCSSTPSFEVENIVVVSSNQSRNDPTKINSHDSCVSSMHFSTWFDYGDGDEDEADTIGRSMRSFASTLQASTLQKSSEFGKEEDAVIQGSLNSSALNSSALTSSAGTSSQDSIQVMENPDGRSGTWTISGTYENASKEEMLKMLKKIQDDILGAADSSSNLATSSSNLANSSSNLSGKNMNSSSSLSACSLVFKPGVQRTVSGITMSAMKSGIKPAPVPVRPNIAANSKLEKAAARKNKRASARNSVIASTTQSGWKKVAVNPGDSFRTKRTGKKKQNDDNAPLTNLSDVKEESLHDISERSNFERTPSSRSTRTNEPSSTRSTRTQVPLSPPSRSEGRKPVEERGTEKRKPRKGRRKPDEADNFHAFEPIHSDYSNCISRESNSSDKTNKVKNKSSTKTGRSKSLSNSSKPKKGSSKHRRSTSLEAAPAKKSCSKKEKSGKETLAYESSPKPESPLPKRASSLRVKSSKAEAPSPKKPSSFNSAHTRASSLNIRTPFKFGRSPSVPTGMEDTTKQKPEKEVKDLSKRRNSTGRMVDKDSKAYASSTEEKERMERSERRERLRQKKDSSLRPLNRKLDKAIGIQASPGPSPGSSAEKKKKSRDLHNKVKEVESLREKFRLSFVKVMSS